MKIATELGQVSLKLAKKGGKRSLSLGAESSRTSAAPRVMWDDTGSVCCLFCSSASKADQAPSLQSSPQAIGMDMTLKFKRDEVFSAPLKISSMSKTLFLRKIPHLQ